jgi:hypothetical protein
VGNVCKAGDSKYDKSERRFTFWIINATKTHSEYVIFIAFPRQKWLGDLSSMLLYTHIANLVHNYNKTGAMSFSYLTDLKLSCYFTYHQV